MMVQGLQLDMIPLGVGERRNGVWEVRQICAGRECHFVLALHYLDAIDMLFSNVHTTVSCILHRRYNEAETLGL